MCVCVCVCVRACARVCYICIDRRQVGSHALWNWLQCWTMYTPLPFNLTEHMGSGRMVAGGGGWSEQPNGTVSQTYGSLVALTLRY